MKIHEATCEYLFNVFEEKFFNTEDVQSEWNEYTSEEKARWYTTKAERLKVDVDSVLETICYDFYCSNDIEDFDERFYDYITEEDKAKLQSVFDEIFDDKFFDIYLKDESIDPFN